MKEQHPKRRKPKNLAEREFFTWASQQGFDVSKRGWPDFFIERDGEIMCVEVKPYSAHPLKVDQIRVMDALSAYGVPCFKWTPDGGLEKWAQKKEPPEGDSQELE